MQISFLSSDSSAAEEGTYIEKRKQTREVSEGSGGLIDRSLARGPRFHYSNVYGGWTDSVTIRKYEVV